MSRDPDAPIASRDSLPASSAAEGRRGSIASRDSLPASSAAEGRRGSIGVTPACEIEPRTPDRARSSDHGDAIDMIRRALAGLRYGELVIAVHDGDIVQISRTEKIRPRADSTKRGHRT